MSRMKPRIEPEPRKRQLRDLALRLWANHIQWDYEKAYAVADLRMRQRQNQ